MIGLCVFAGGSGQVWTVALGMPATYGSMALVHKLWTIHAAQRTRRLTN